MKLSPRVIADLEQVLEDRDSRFGAPGHEEASSTKVALNIARGAGVIADKSQFLPGTGRESVLHFRERLLAQAATALRAVDAIDRYDLALHWAETEREATR